MKSYLILLITIPIAAFEFTEIQDCDLNNSHASALYLIDQPGKYKLIEDIIAKPTNANVSCFKITSNNVNLHFNGFSLSQKSGTGSGLTAIEIASNVSSIVIDGLEVTSIDGTGLKIQAGANNILITNGTIASCTRIGLDIDQAHELETNNTNINLFDGSHSGATNGAVGIKLNQSTSCRFINVLSNKGKQTGSKEACGWLIQSCNNCLFDTCKAIANESKKSTAGFYLISSINNHFKNCKAEGTVATDDSYGFRLDQYNNFNLFEDCECSFSKSSGGNGFGFYVKNGNGNYFKNCIAIGNSGANIAGKEATGFYFTGECNSFVINSLSKANNGKIGYGIHLVNTIYCTFEANKIFANTGTENGYGIKDDASSSNNFILKNLAYANQDSTTNKKVNNYHAKLSPDDSTSKFPIVSVFLNNFARAAKATTLDNIEAIERPSGCNS